MLIFVLVWGGISVGMVEVYIFVMFVVVYLLSFGFECEMIFVEVCVVVLGVLFGIFNLLVGEFVEFYCVVFVCYGMIGIVLMLLFGFVGGVFVFLWICFDFIVCISVECVVMLVLLLVLLVVIFIIFGIFVLLVFEIVCFFGIVSLVDFLFGIYWSLDLMVMLGLNVGENYGVLLLFWGIFVIGVVIVMLVVILLGLMSVIYFM